MIPALWDLLQYSLTSLNANIIWSYQNAARIPKPYLVVNYTTVNLPDHEHYSLPDANGIITNSSWRRATVDLQFYCAKDSYGLASRAASLLATNTSLEKQAELDVSIGHRLFLQRVPALLNESQYEDRAIYQFEFYYTENISDVASLIETVVIDGSYKAGIPDEPGIPNDSGYNLTDLNCHHVISIFPTIWDNMTTEWDDNTTEWDDYYNDK